MSSSNHSTQQTSNVFAILADLGQDLSLKDDEQLDTEPTSTQDTMVSASPAGGTQLPEDDRMFVEPYDLVNEEEQAGFTPIFTRVLLKSIRNQKRNLMHDFELPDEKRTIADLKYHSSGGEIRKVWQDDRNEEPSDVLALRYMTRVEMNREFQSRFGKFSKHIQLLRRYNDVDLAAHFRTPYSFDFSHSFDRILLDEHKDPSAMKEYHRSLENTMAIWLESEARDQFEKTISAAAVVSAPIRRIVCFGLGRIQFADDAWYGSVLQHLAVFTIVKVLETRYKEVGLNYRPIDILFQDPTYEKKDWILIRELHHAMGCGANSRVYSVTDPEGLLAVDTNIFVVTAFLPFQVPLMQIIADLFASSSGPAAFLCDKMALDTNKRNYILQDRDSPAVARFFFERYLRLDDAFPDHGIESELKQNTSGERGPFYWLSEMDLHVRKRA